MSRTTVVQSQWAAPNRSQVLSLHRPRHAGGGSFLPCLTRRKSEPSAPAVIGTNSSPLRGGTWHQSHAVVFDGCVWGKSSEEEVTSICARWVDKHIIGLELCPFAAPARRATRFRVSSAPSVDTFLQEFDEELRLLAGTLREEKAATTLFILPPRAAGDWHVFMEEYYQAAQEEVSRAGLSESIQLVPFHPDSTYSDFPDDCADYALRSPFPTIHLLRQRDVDAAEKEWLKLGKYTGDIAEKNAAMLNGIGARQLAAMMRSWFGRDTS